jgi:S1-C subfamily serine protease
MRLLASLLVLALSASLAPAQNTEPSVEKSLSVVRVNVTNQPWDFGRPWGKRPPFSRRAIGGVLPGERVLVTAELVGNATFVEFESAGGGQKVPATVEFVDYECNLALLKTDDVAFLKALRPLEIAPAKIGDQLSVWQVESNGTLNVTHGPMTTAEVLRYPVDDSPFLVYRLTAQLQFRDTSFPLPVVKGDKLVGLLQRYDNAQNNADVIPAPVIEHFLKDAAQPPYEGFPRLGMAYSQTRDPQLRRYAGLKNGNGGVYVTDVLPGGPAEKAGLVEGDVVLKIDGETIDQDGNYNDPLYGRISLSHLVGTQHFHGNELKFDILRKGEPQQIAVTIANRPVTSYVIEPYVIDRAPPFYILGGLVLQELSRQYLKEWGPDWKKKAPEQFVYLDAQQNELFKDGPKKIVFLSRVLPSEATMGYEEVHSLVVKKVNGVALQSLADLPDALRQAKDGVHKIEFDGDPGAIYLDAAQVTTLEPLLAKKYRLPTMQRVQ